MSQRVVKGIFYAHDGQVFGFFDTDQPYDIPGCSQLVRKARNSSTPQLGNITVRLVESPKFPKSQGFAVLTDRRRVNRGEFERMVRTLFHGSKLDVHWVTNFNQYGGQLLFALVARKILFDS